MISCCNIISNYKELEENNRSVKENSLLEQHNLNSNINSISIIEDNNTTKYFKPIDEHYKNQSLISIVKSNHTDISNNKNSIVNSMYAVYMFEKEVEVSDKVNRFRDLILKTETIDNNIFKYLSYLETEKKFLSNTSNLDKIIFDKAIENINILLHKKQFRYNDYLIYLSELMINIKDIKIKNNSDQKLITHLIQLITNEMYI